MNLSIIVKLNKFTIHIVIVKYVKVYNLLSCILLFTIFLFFNIIWVFLCKIFYFFYKILRYTFNLNTLIGIQYTTCNCSFVVFIVF